MKTRRRLPIALAALALLNLSARVTAQQGLPGGGSVVSGSATIGAPAAGQLTVRQDSQRAIIDWNSFSIGAGQSVRFVQPGADAAVLNRVTGSTPSTIAGSLSGNGQVFLVNPNGIAITPTGAVQLGGGFVASTLDIRNDDFMAGRLGFSARDGATGCVANAGTVQVAPGGYVALLSDRVSNEGRISAPLGRVALGAGSQATLDLSGDGFLQIGWNGGTRAADSGVDVSGSVQAVGGRIELKAADARAALRSVVNVSGSLVATSVSGRDGAIVLEAGSGGSAQVSGQIDVSGQAGAGRVAISGNAVTIDGEAARIDARSAAGRGGAVSATAHDALTLGRVVVDASGVSGGGSVLLGGDLRGGGTLAHARTTDVQTGASIRADALVQGTGGSIVLWSDERTEFRGLLSARGAGSGAGGSAEVSSHGVLGFEGNVDLRAVSGRSGELLLDPFNVTISTGADSNHNASFTATGNSSVINTTTLQTALASANVTVSTGSSGVQSGDITVANTLTWASGNTLTLTAARDVTLNAAVSATHGGGLTATAGRNVNVNSNLTGSGAAFNVALQASPSAGAVSISNATIATNGGTLTASATQSGAAAITLTNAGLSVGTGSGSLTASSNNNGLIINGSLSVNGNVTLQGSTSASVATVTSPNRFGVNFATGSSVSLTSGTLVVTGTATNNAAGLYAAGNLTLTNTGSGSLSLAGVSASGYATRLGGGTLTSTGNVSVSGSGTRLVIDSGAAFVVTGGSLAISGSNSSSTVAAISIKGTDTFTNTAGGALTFTGTSSGYRGIEAQTSAALTFNGTTSMTGSSSTGQGIYIDGAITLATGTLGLSGTSTSGFGLYQSATGSLTNSGNLTLTGNGGMSLRGSTISTSGVLSLGGSGTIDQGSTGSITAASLSVQGSSANYALDSASNQIATIAGSAASLTLVDAGGLTVGTVSGTSGIATTGAVSLRASGSVTLASGASVQGGNPVIAAGSHFVNQAGSSAVVATSGRWLIYSADASGNTFGTLDSGNTALWNQTYASLAPASVTASGSRYVFAHQPTLTFSSIATSKVYGDDASSSLGARYTVSGYDGGVPHAYLADSASTAFGGTPTLSSTGAAATATVSGGPYVISIAQGTATSNTGYALVFDSSGSLSVTPRALTVQAGNASHVYGNTLTFAGTEFSTSGLVNSDSVSSVSLASTGASATANVGSYAITSSGATGSDLSNYSVSYLNGTLSVTPRALTVQTANGTHVYGNALSFAGTEFSATGLVNSDTVSSVSLASTGASGTAGVGTYAITGSSASGSGLSNYSISYLDGSLGVTPRALTVQASSGSHVYGNALTFAGTEFTATGLVNGDSVTTVNLSSTGASGTTNVGSYAITGSGASGSGLSNYSISYLNGVLAVTPRALYYVADVSTRPYGVSNLPLNGALIGFVNGDTVASATSGSLRWSTTAGPGTATGLYAIVGSGLQVPSGNYVLAQAASNATALRITDTPLPAVPSLFLASARPSLKVGNDAGQPLPNCGPCAGDAAAINACPVVTRDDGGR